MLNERLFDFQIFFGSSAQNGLFMSCSGLNTLSVGKISAFLFLILTLLLLSHDLFHFRNNKQIKMNYFNAMYPFLNMYCNPYSLNSTPYPIQMIYDLIPLKQQYQENTVKVEEAQIKRTRTDSKVFAKIKKLIKELHHQATANKKIHWTSEQDQLLEKLVQQQHCQWKSIPDHFTGRTQNMCYSRYRRIKLNSKQKRWTQEEEQILIKRVNEYGEKWKKISLQLKNYTAKQIREKFLNYLRPNIDKSDFTVDQDFKICKFIIQNGRHWRKLQEELPSRSEGLIKGRYYGKLEEIIQRASRDDQD